MNIIEIDGEKVLLTDDCAEHIWKLKLMMEVFPVPLNPFTKSNFESDCRNVQISPICFSLFSIKQGSNGLSLGISFIVTILSKKSIFIFFS